MPARDLSSPGLVQALAAQFVGRIESDPNGGCWLWSGADNGVGYGRVYLGGIAYAAHRVSYVHSVGPIPENHHVDHLCRVSFCVNPAHLEAVTQRVNTLRGVSRTAQQARQTSCVRGHEFTPANTYHDKRGRRACRTCRSTQDRARRAMRPSACTDQGAET